MPVMDGYEATLRIREIEKNQLTNGEQKSYIVGLTAHDTENYRSRCFETGMDYYSKFYQFLKGNVVTKPVDSAKIETLLKSLGLL